MVIIREQSPFVIEGDIEEIKAELAKGSLKEDPKENEQGVFVGKIRPEIVWSSNKELLLPACDVVMTHDRIGMSFPLGVCFFKDEDEKLYSALQAYVTAIVNRELNKL